MATTLEPRKVRRSEDFDALEWMQRYLGRNRPYAVCITTEHSEDSIPSTKRWIINRAAGKPPFVLEFCFEDNQLLARGGFIWNGSLNWPINQKVLGRINRHSAEFVATEGLAAFDRIFSRLRHLSRYYQ